MAGEHLIKQKQFRVEELTLEGKFDRAEKIVHGNTYSPLFHTQSYHPEAEPDSEALNDDLSDILNDLFILDGEFSVLAENYNSLLREAVQKINASKSEVLAAREKIMDLNMICAEGSGFFQTITLTDSHFEEPVFNKDNTITAKPTGSETISCRVIDVTGNGLEGNEYIFVSGQFVSATTSTNNREYMTDGSVTTIYEYQKINVGRSEPYVFADASLDGTEAYCTITIETSQPVSSVKILSPDNEIVLKEVQVSSNNEEYLSAMSGNIKFNKREDMYLESRYIYESGIVAFPLSRYIKLSFSSDGYTNDKIAFLQEHLE